MTNHTHHITHNLGRRMNRASDLIRRIDNVTPDRGQIPSALLPKEMDARPFEAEANGYSAISLAIRMAMRGPTTPGRVFPSRTAVSRPPAAL